eukprot:TRINITY_DN44261_c0_g1_i1.p1 TRINITY_DN44261_c0_g1~~TRINITY_DN44261_c0_g1_i1.p1  ORF type:complete len:420 (+),score=105.65 TRINITY_DN44261_c0_g1_i1:176-1435(+)
MAAAVNEPETAWFGACDAGEVEKTVREAVANVQVVDVHTHLFPASHGKLLLWGVDELMTYHYLCAEYFMVRPLDDSPAEFYHLSKSEQADRIFQELFVNRSPLSEACRGVLTTLQQLGCHEMKDLNEIRSWFATQDPNEYIEKVFKIAGIEYAVMTNIPFDDEEARHWLDGRTPPDCLKSALRIDPLITKPEEAMQKVVAQGFENTNQGAIEYLKWWAQRIDAMYLFASFESSFEYPDGPEAKVLDEIVFPACRQLNLPFGVKMGTCRQVNPALGQAGDCVGISDVGALSRICQKNPDIKFLVTYLARANQHELCVVARKFSNLHVYGCWWFCNNPSIVDEMTRQRLELMGSAFTCQHSDARILDQLIYKWNHSRRIIAEVLVEKYNDLVLAGWKVTPEAIQRDVQNLFGGSFKQFMTK